MSKGRYVLMIDNREVSRHNLLTVARSNGTKLAQAHPRSRVIIQDAAPKDDGEPMIWSYAGRGVFRATRFFVAPARA